MAKFRGPDFYDMDSLLTEEEILIRDTVRDWVSERFLPLVEKAYREGYFPLELIPELGEMGVLGGNLEYGDLPGMSNVAYGLVAQEMERGDSGLRSFGSGAGRTRDVPDLAVRHGGAEGEVAARRSTPARRSALSV